MGTMCTRNLSRARTKSSPEQKVDGKASGRGRPASDLAALTFTGPTDWIEPGGYAQLSPLKIFYPGDFRFCFSNEEKLARLEGSKAGCESELGPTPEKLNESKCFPLFTQQRTSPRYFRMSVSCLSGSRRLIRSLHNVGDHLSQTPGLAISLGNAT
jgi:hypothetical protein